MSSAATARARPAAPTVAMRRPRLDVSPAATARSADLSGGGAACYGSRMSLISQIAALQDYKEYEDLNWEGSFEDYLHLVRKNPRVTRNAYQRVYDMILAHGQEEYIDNKKKLIRFKFFKDEAHGGQDAVYGLDVPLMRLMSVFKSAAQGYGTERRVILLHGPVGSAKSTIVRQLKRGLEAYSRTPDGALFTYRWELPG